jgi:hypothetical protein
MPEDRRNYNLLFSKKLCVRYSKPFYLHLPATGMRSFQYREKLEPASRDRGANNQTRPLTGSASEILMMHTNRKTSGDGQQGQVERRRQDRRGRRSRAEIPRRDYAAIVAVFNGVLATALFARKCSREPLPERIEPKDLALFALATQKLSRVITKDKVTSAFRAPFTEVEGKGGPGEVEERAKGRGIRRAVGELLTCPFCLGTWIASGFIYGYVFVPRISRILASIFAVSGLADFVQQLYVKTQEINEQR